MKILNLYAGIGGNRKLWEGHQVTAVELDENIAKIYKDFFPNDEVIVGDAHQYLLDHYKEFDFIWSSPPCPSHSRARYWGSFGGRVKLIYPDMSLYQEILFLKHYCKTKWVVENVVPYYKPMITGQKVGRHLYWSNFDIKEFKSSSKTFPKDCVSEMEKLYGFDLSKHKIDKTLVLRNCVEPEVGLHILNCI